MMVNTDMLDRETTRRFVILDVIAAHTGEKLTPDLVEQIVDELIWEISGGNCSWAFATIVRREYE